MIKVIWMSMLTDMKPCHVPLHPPFSFNKWDKPTTYLESRCSYSSPAALPWPPPRPRGGNKADSALQLLRWPEQGTWCSWLDRAPDTPDRSCHSLHKRGLNPDEETGEKTDNEKPSYSNTELLHFTSWFLIYCFQWYARLTFLTGLNISDALPFSLIN